VSSRDTPENHAEPPRGRVPGPETFQSSPALSQSGTLCVRSNRIVPVCVRLPGGRNVIGTTGDPWVDLYRITDVQHGRISTAQLRAIGWSDQSIRTNTRRQVLRRVHHGVYAAGSADDQSPDREAGAILAVGPDARLTGRSVMALVDLLVPDPAEAVHVILPDGRKARNRDGIAVHRYTGAGSDQVRYYQGLPGTPVERAILDAAGGLSDREVERVLDEALATRLTSRTKVSELLAVAGHTRSGAGLLAALIDPARAGAMTKLEAAALALKLIRESGMPEPETEVELFGFTADFYWPEAGVVLEIDSFAWHGVVRKNFNRDRTKDRVFRRHGLTVVRATATDLTGRPLPVITDLAMTVADRLATRAA
jgi:hypothetical protein